MIKRSTMATIVLAAVAAATLPAAGLAQPGGGKLDAIERAVKVPCCTCVDGSIKTASLNTGAVAWSVSGPGVSGSTTAVATSSAAWAPIGATWIGHNAAASQEAGAGTYIYTVRFVVPRCVLGGRVTLKGKAGGDNRVTVKLNGATIGSTPGTTSYGFQAANFANFNAPVTQVGLNTVTVEVKNDGGPSGMALQGTVEVECPKRAELGNS